MMTVSEAYKDKPDIYYNYKAIT